MMDEFRWYVLYVTELAKDGTVRYARRGEAQRCQASATSLLGKLSRDERSGAKVVPTNDLADTPPELGADEIEHRAIKLSVPDTTGLKPRPSPALLWTAAGE